MKTIVTIGVSVLLSLAVAWMILESNSPRIAYVRSNELIYTYDGTKEAQAKFIQQKESWQANIDTLKMNFQQAVSSYNANYAKLSPAERQQQETMLATQEAQLKQYVQAIETKSSKQDDEMMQSVLNQINSFARNYAEEHGYDVILGTTHSGSILYGTEALDITEELLISLNKQYRNE